MQKTKATKQLVKQLSGMELNTSRRQQLRGLTEILTDYRKKKKLLKSVAYIWSAKEFDIQSDNHWPNIGKR